MRRMAFILFDGSLPVPAVMGGAIQNLLTMLIEQNELNPKFEFHFIMSKTDSEKEVKNIYKYTKLYQINTSKLERKIFKYINYVNRLCSFKLPLFSPYNRKTLKLINKINPEIIIYENMLDTSILKLKRNKNKFMVIQHVHGCLPNKQRYYKNIKNTIAVSNFIKQDWLKECPAANVKILPNAINEKHFDISKITKEQKFTLRQQLGISPTDFVVLYTGRIVPEKGILQLIEAFEQINEKNIKLLIVGDINSGRKVKRSEYMKQIEDKIKNNFSIIKTGFIPYETLVNYYAVADVQVIPSLCEEASGMTAIEGNYCGLAQIITNSGGLPENCSSSTIIIDKNGDVVSQLKEAILEVRNKNIKNSQNVKALTAKEYFNVFTNIIKQFEDEYNGEI